MREIQPRPLGRGSFGGGIGIDMDHIRPLFTATATATGGRNGHTESQAKPLCAVKKKIFHYSHATRSNVQVDIEVVGA